MEDHSWLAYLTHGLEAEIEDRSRQVYKLLDMLTITRHIQLNEADRTLEKDGSLSEEYKEAVINYDSLADVKAASVFEKVTSASRSFKLSGEIYAKASQLARDWPYPEEELDYTTQRLEVLSNAYATLHGLFEIAMKENGLDPEFYNDGTVEYFGLTEVRFRIEKAIKNCGNLSIQQDLEELRDTEAVTKIYSTL